MRGPVLLGFLPHDEGISKTCATASQMLAGELEIIIVLLFRRYLNGDDDDAVISINHVWGPLLDVKTATSYCMYYFSICITDGDLDAPLTSALLPTASCPKSTRDLSTERERATVTVVTWKSKGWDRVFQPVAHWTELH